MAEIPQLFTSWSFWYWVGGAIVLVAAALLITILLVARSIGSHARRALEAARTIQERTEPIWALDGTLETLVSIRDRTRAIVEKTEILAGVLHGETGAARSER